ncbi:VMAP-C domain-containing protein [Streptomyces lincolnensis]|uniref:VMAP-C domain-containing protein n=1 Tax=Streptomyces lincolnensis TaxID=1915 RepID=UPI0037CF8C6E
MGTGVGGSEGGSGRAHGPLLLLELTNSLGALGCMEDAQSRLRFGDILGELLGRRIDLRGAKLREDVVVLVRSALNVADGERVLVEVVRILEGESAGDQLELLLASFLAPVKSTPLQGGALTADEESGARAVLALGELPAPRLRDDLVEELNGLSLPVGLSAERLFTYVLDCTTQADRLPPAVLLLDCAAPLAGTPDHRAALSGWVDDWSRRAGLTEELEGRRRARAEGPHDPDIPRCVIIAIEPARDGTDDIVVRQWFNSVPGHWSPLPGEPATTTLDELGPAVEGALRQSARLWHAPPAANPATRQQPPLYVEFVLPYELLNHDVAGLTYQIGDGEPMPLSLKYGVHLRSLERMRADDPLWRDQWIERWNTLRAHGVLSHDWPDPDIGSVGMWQRRLAGEAMHTAVVLDAPTDAASQAALKAAIAEGIGLAVWDRAGVFVEAGRQKMSAVLSSVHAPVQIPMAIHRLRQKAASRNQGPAELHLKDIGFLWDDPTRPVDFQPTDPGDLTNEEAPE